jgi:hypothetical protein
MKRAAGIVGSSVAAVVALAVIQPERGDGWTREFGVEAGELASTGRNPFFSLSPVRDRCSRTRRCASRSPCWPKRA